MGFMMVYKITPGHYRVPKFVQTTKRDHYDQYWLLLCYLLYVIQIIYNLLYKLYIGPRDP